ncbi:hypothetical protein KAT80_03900 [Candidatus Pacearchaeota archaeon]|nr:hypothetical protein [Candidatus Pacearchaeota archaeon]
MEDFGEEYIKESVRQPSMKELQKKQIEIAQSQATFNKILAIATIILAYTSILYLTMFVFFGIIRNISNASGKFGVILLFMEMVCMAIISIILFVVLITNLSKLYPKKKE